MDARFKQLAADIAPLLHKHRQAEAAQHVVDTFQIPKLKINAKDDPKKFLPVLQYFMHECLEAGGFAEVANMLWTPNQFSAEPQSVKDVWGLFDDTDMGLIMGAAKMGKSFSMGVRLFLEYIRDPEWTTIRVVGPSESHLEENLFSHLVSLHQHATLPMPGEVGELFIGLDRRNQLSAIAGVVIPKGNSKKAGRLQGGHRRPRLVPHPIFGPLSRLFIFIDEIENVPTGIWMDIDNVLSEIEKGGLGFKIFGAYNPTDISARVATQAEPDFGWPELDADTHYKWKSKRGWTVLRVDGEKCENVVQDKIIFPGLQTREGLDRIARNAGGVNGPGYLTMGRGMYPISGVSATIIPAGMWAKWRGEFIWYEDPTPVSADDLALEGSDAAIRSIGKWGLASGMKLPPTVKNPKGEVIMFKDARGQVTPRWGLELSIQVELPKGDTRVMTDNVIKYNRDSGTKPEYYACDRTGNGAGVADLVKNEWSPLIHDVNFSQSASEEKLMLEDTRTCKEEYDRIQTELWFALRYWGEFGILLINPAVNTEKLTPEVTSRQFTSKGSKKKVESKTEYKKRGNVSPNYADSLTLLVYAARKGSGMTQSMKGTLPEGNTDWMDDWPGSGMKGGSRIDESNRADFLDTRDDRMFEQPIL